jgi:pimeloyl-ACP methyl ester carboxylesterase
VSAFAPDLGETLGALADKFGPGALDTALVPDAAGFLFIDRTKFHDVFCADIPASETQVLAATQKPVAEASFGQSPAAVAWKTIPSWYLVTRDDHAVNPDVQRFMATRMGAHITEINSSHVSFVSHPTAVVRIIEEAAFATAK